MTVPPVFNRYLEQAKDFARKLVRAETGTRRWATVTAIDPVRITYDGTTTQGIIPPVVLGTPVTIGDRVRAHTIHDRTYITLANPDSRRQFLSGSEVFGVVDETVRDEARAAVDIDSAGRGTVTLYLRLSGLTIPGGSHNLRLGVLTPSLRPSNETTLSGHRAGVAVTCNMTIAGDVSVRHTTGNIAGQPMFLSATYPIW